MKRRILFITGTRADYGKIKTLIKGVERLPDAEPYIFVSGMHLLEKYGSTYREVEKDGYQHVHYAFELANSSSMSYNLGDVICALTQHVAEVKPDMIVVHGDRIDAMAGAIVGALNNIRVAHIEGGELSGTIDESIRHAISKLAHVHLVCNEEAKRRLMQLGENEERIFVIGSPDIDVMLSDALPDLAVCKSRYEIPFDRYGILMYHPVTTEVDCLPRRIKAVVDAVIESGRNFIVIYPNNDLGSEIILKEYERFAGNSHFRVFPSMRFECFLTFLKHAESIVGNSSAGIRESGVYGVPAIDIGSRQAGRYSLAGSPNIRHVDGEARDEILTAFDGLDACRQECRFFGSGDSTGKFIDVIVSAQTWTFDIQKKFVDVGWSNE